VQVDGSGIVEAVKTLWLLLLPVLLFCLLAVGFWVASFYVSSPNSQAFKDNWVLYAQMGSTFQGLGSLFVSLAVGVSFITYNESSKRLLETAKVQAESLKLLQTQAAASVLTAQIQSLTARLQGYEEQIGMIRSRNANSMTPERRTEENAGVQRMRSEQDKLYRQLDRVLDDLKIGTKADVPPEGTYSNPFPNNLTAIQDADGQNRTG
jgi:hypothetical protein